MRKKYLSALLFGALLVTSAGTFTSCKDYDDEINDLQEQINKVATDLESLKTTVDNLGGVTDVKIEDGKLLVTAGGQTVSYDLPTSTESDVEKTTVELKGQDLVVDGEVIGQVGDKVTVNEEGYLCVNGKATEIKAGKYAVLENDADGVVTITLPDANGELKTIELAKAATASFSLYPVQTYAYVGGSYCQSYYSLFTEINPTISSKGATDWDTSAKFETENGIAWGVASSDLDWKGPKGAIKAGQLLIGQQNNVFVSVRPLNVDLSSQSLKLVDAKGNVAPVKVDAYSSSINNANTGSRSVSNIGDWTLKISMDNTITENNIGTAFAEITDQTGNHDLWSNKRYALQVNGDLLTGYNFVIDTDVEKCQMEGKDELVYNENNIKLDGQSQTKSNFTEVSLNKEHYLSFEQGSVYDYKFEIVEADINDAEAWGITLENNVLKGTNTAAGKTIRLNVQLLGVDGKVENLGLTHATTNTISVTFGKIETSAITLPVSTYKITPAEYENSITSSKYATVTLNMGELFSGLSAQEAISVKKGQTVLETTDETFAFLRKSIVNDYGTGTEGSTIKFYKADGSEVKFDDETSNIRDIKTAKVYYMMSDPSSLWNSKATVGEHLLKLTLKDESGNEIRKANVPVNVTIPTFFELFTKSGAWTEETALAVVNENGTVDLKQLYNDKTNITSAVFDSEESSFIVDNNPAGSISGNILTLTPSVVNGSHLLKDLNTELVYKIVPLCENFWVSTDKFTMDLVTKLDGAKFVYYGADGKEADIVVEPESENTIPAFKVTDGVKSGLSFYKAGNDHVFTAGVVVNGLKLDVANNYTCTFDDKAGAKAKAEFSYGNLTISGLAKGDYVTELTITYKKAATINGNTDVWETFKLKLNVQAAK